MAVDVDAIRARAEAATEGPWETRGYEQMPGKYVVGPRKAGDLGRGPVILMRPLFCDERSAANAEFIAHAREDVPALLAEVERLRALVPKCACGPWHPDMDGPDEECPQHGRSYREWIDRGDRLAATLNRVREALELELYFGDDRTGRAHAWGALQQRERIRAAIEGADS